MTDRQILLVLGFGLTTSGFLWDDQTTAAAGAALLLAHFGWLFCAWGDRRRKPSGFAQYKTEAWVVRSSRPINPEEQQ
jgi:hypothetical protein